MKTIVEISLNVGDKIINYKVDMDEEVVGKLKIDTETLGKMRVELVTMVGQVYGVKD